MCFLSCLNLVDHYYEQLTYNKIPYPATKRQTFIFVTFYVGEVATGSNWNLRGNVTPYYIRCLSVTVSRLVPKYSEPFEDTIIAALRTDCEIKNIIANTIKELPVTLLEIKSEAMNDDFITNIKQKITAKIKKVPEVFSLCDNLLLYSERVVIPKKLQNRFFRDFRAGHPGINRMKSLLRSYVCWLKMDNDIRDMIKKCKGCVLTAKAPPLLSNLG